MSKKLHIAAITNELSEGSAFFRPYTPQPPKPDAAALPQAGKQPGTEHRKAQTSQEQHPAGTSTERANGRTTVRPKGKRIITRNSFETFEDQMETLRRLLFEEKMEGKLGSMSAMVREAIDDYLQKRAVQKKPLGNKPERPNDCSSVLTAEKHPLNHPTCRPPNPIGGSVPHGATSPVSHVA